MNDTIYGIYIWSIIILFFLQISVNKDIKFIKEKWYKLCPYCKQQIHKEATRCNHCLKNISQAKIGFLILFYIIVFTLTISIINILTK